MANIKSKTPHITAPDKFGYQVRIVRRGKEHSKYFSHKLWGSPTKALKAAMSWRDQMKVALKGSRVRGLGVPKNKQTTGVTGVSRTIKYDKRKDKSYLCYTVYWVDETGKSRNKSFQVGNVTTVTADADFHAFRTARVFRYMYENAIDTDTTFDHSVFKYWRERRVYDEPNPADSVVTRI